jgi:septum site-determining protein MinC
MSSFAAVVHPPSLTVRMEQSVPVLVIPEGMGFEALRSWLRERLPDHQATIGGRTTRLDLGAREIVLFDLRRTIHFLRQEFSIEITGLYVRPDAVHRFAERELKLKLFSVEPAFPAPDEAETEEIVTGPAATVADLAGELLDDEAEDDDEPEIKVEEAVVTDAADEEEAEERAPSALESTKLPHDLEPEDLEATPSPTQTRDDGSRRTQAVHRTLRSGASVRFDGDVYVYGDVNPGAQVVATGNIVVLGALKGVAHAGAAGDEKSFILAFELRPTQLRIARKIAIPPARAAGGELAPELATVVDGQVQIEPYKGRLRL